MATTLTFRDVSANMTKRFDSGEFRGRKRSSQTNLDSHQENLIQIYFFLFFQQINSAFSFFSLGAHPDAQCTYVFADITAHQVAGGSLWVPIITQSGPKVQALIIVSSRDSKIKDLAPIALLCASTDPRCSDLLTVDFRETERVCVCERVCV